MECDFSDEFSQLPAGGKIVCDVVFTLSIYVFKFFKY